MTPLGNILQSVMVEDPNQELRAPIHKYLVQDQHLVNNIHKLLGLLENHQLSQQDIDELNETIKEYI